MGKTKTKVFSNVWFMLKLVFKYTPLYFCNLVLMAVLFQVEVFFEFTYCTKYLLDLMQYGGSFESALKYMLFVACMVIVKIIWAAISTYKIAPKAKEKLHKELQEELYANAVRLDLARYDDPECYNEFVFSVSEAGIRVDGLLLNIERFLGAFTRILILGVFFLSYDIVGILFIIVSLVIAFVTNHISAELQFKMDSELKPIQRKRNYFSRVFYLSDYAKELRLYPVAETFENEFHETNGKVAPVVKKYGRKQFLWQLLNEWVSEGFIINIIYTGYLLYQAVVKKVFSYGSVISLLSATSNLKNSLKTVIELAAKFRQDSFYIDKIREFLSFSPQIASGDRRAEKENFMELELKNVSFGYDVLKPILKDVSLNIKNGEKIAIVGYNGAGKTTLIKLLMRLYDVNAGDILLNGHSIKEYETDSYRKMFGSVFQDYRLYGATLAENVKTDVVGEDGTAEASEDLKRIKEALVKSGFEKRLKYMENGLDTSLTREFDDKGTNLSGGEAQKVAIARAFYQDCPVILLDEPSSALDPVSEYYLNEAMLRAANNKTVIFISHRLSTAKLADRIYMLENGQIVESGSHKELMELNGKYAVMYNVQAEKYREIRF